ncbi:MAG TPA: radical SAM protein [Chloroflexota bacterium]|nr:radical SAM protein [Chloroflexota bacterium]
MVATGRVNSAGQLTLDEEQRRRWGLDPGTDFYIQETPDGLLLRRTDPPLTTVYVEPTNGCNLSCRTCVRHSWNEATGQMEMSVYRRLVEGLKSIPTLRKMNFWGIGEPLLHRGLSEMVALAKQELGVQTQLVTNALLLTEQLSRDLVDAGLDSLVVSIDGVTPEGMEDIRDGADLRLVKENVRRLQDIRYYSPHLNPELGIEFVAMRRNLKEMPGLRRLANSLNASFIVVTNVLPYTREMSDEILYNLSAGSSYPSQSSVWSPEVRLPRMDLTRETVPALAGLLAHTREGFNPRGRLDGAGGYCRFISEGSAVVGWDGEVSPCVGLMHSYRCFVMGKEKSIRRFTLGNAGTQDIADIWANPEFARFRDLVMRFDFSPCTDCGGCDLSEKNEADCAGNGFPVCGDCLWGKGVIQCP